MKIIEDAIDVGYRHFDCARVYNTVSIFIPGHTAKETMIMLNRQGVYVSTGSACTSMTEGPSHVLTEMGGKKTAESSIRISYAPDFDIRLFTEFLDGFSSTGRKSIYSELEKTGSTTSIVAEKVI